MKGRRSVPIRVGVLEIETARRCQRDARRSRPDLSLLSDAELESLLPLAERTASAGVDLVLTCAEQAMLETFLPRVQWRPA